MIFLTKDDFISQINAEHLEELTDENDALLSMTEGRALEEMTGYISIRYDAIKTFDPDNRSPLVVMYLVDMVLYHLHARISPDHVPEFRKDRYDSARDWLEKIADGFTNPGLPTIDEEEKTAAIRYGSSSTKRNSFY